VAVALSLPPWGWWPLAYGGMAVLAWAIDGRNRRARLAVGVLAGIAVFVPGLWWVGDFSQPGAVILVAGEALLLGLGFTLVPAHAGRVYALPGALVLFEALRGSAPWGGLPLAGVDLGQAVSPLAPTARLGGHLLVVGLSALAGTGIYALTRRRRSGLIALAVVGAFVVGAGVAPDGGRSTPSANRRVGLVQGGGRLGTRAYAAEDKARVFDRHLAASSQLAPALDLVLWPEDSVDVDTPLATSPEGAAIADIARRHQATVVAGVVQASGARHFSNAAIAWAPDGRIVARYDKVHRVPFGEYVPGRDVLSKVADLSAVPRDAIAGTGPGLLRTPAGPLGVTISYEVFFAGRARAAVAAGGRLLLVPTNASSYRRSQVPGSELAASRLRAIETGRDLIQAAPTGYSAVIDHRGRLRARSHLGDHTVVSATVRLRAGTTAYVATGDSPTLVLAGLALVVAHLLQRRCRASVDSPAG